MRKSTYCYVLCVVVAEIATGCTSDAPSAGDAAIGVVAQALGPSPDGDCEFFSSAGRDYWFCDTERNWQTARDKCRAVPNFDLVVINNATENAFVRSHVPDDSWIGASDIAAEGVWRWAETGTQFWQGNYNGSAVGGAYTNWSSLQPNSSSEDCAIIDDASSAKWSDVSCTGNREYVCEGIADLCPSDSSKILPGQCGCGVPDTDGDGDGTANCIDGCATDPNKSAPGQCGCANPDTDGDGDGAANCVDGCPADSTKIVAGVCGCGVADTDADGDGVPNCKDSCPSDSRKVVPGDCGCASAPAPQGTSCDDGLCTANTTCDGAGLCGSSSQCTKPDTLCTFAQRAGTPYWFCENDRLYTDARGRCQNVGMDLAVIESAGEDSFVTSNADEHSFLGGSDEAVEGTWRWLPTAARFWTGDEAGAAVGGAYTNWESGEPSDSLGSHDCVAKSSIDGKWESHSCTVHDAYVCEGVPPPGSDLDTCAENVKPREDLTGEARERAYQADLQRFCAAPGSSACLNDLRGRVNLDYTSAALALHAQQKTPAEYLAISRDRGRKARSFDANPSVAAAICGGDADGDLVPDSTDACPTTPPLTPTDDVGCTDSNLPAAPSATAVASVLERMGYAFNSACEGASILARPTIGGIYSSIVDGPYVFAGRVTNQPIGCPVRYVLEVETVNLLSSAPGFEVLDRFSVAFLDTEEVTALVGRPVPVPNGMIQFHASPTDAGTRGQLGAATGHIRYRLKVINGAGMQSSWSTWHLTDLSDCTFLGLHCQP